MSQRPRPRPRDPDPQKRGVSDAGQARTAAARAKLRRDQELDDVRALMDLPAGRRFMWRLLERAGIYRTTFTGNSATFFNEGMRNLGLIFVADVHEACPEQYTRMLAEARADLQADQTENQHQAGDERTSDDD